MTKGLSKAAPSAAGVGQGTAGHGRSRGRGHARHRPGCPSEHSAGSGKHAAAGGRVWRARACSCQPPPLAVAVQKPPPLAPPHLAATSEGPRYWSTPHQWPSWGSTCRRCWPLSPTPSPPPPTAAGLRPAPLPALLVAPRYSSAAARGVGGTPRRGPGDGWPRPHRISGGKRSRTVRQTTQVTMARVTASSEGARGCARVGEWRFQQKGLSKCR